MAIIQKEIELAGSKGKIKEIALFDSGATYSCIRKELAEKLEIIVSLPEPIELGTAKEGEKLKANERISIDFHLNGYRFSDEFIVIPDLAERVIIGAKTLQAWRLKLDFENDEVIVDPRVTKLRLLVTTRLFLFSF
ncbi:MAG: retropepsin-like aspartic protease [Elusimicrobiota bacterium]